MIARIWQQRRELQESEQRFRELFDHLPVPYFSLDEGGRWRDANQRMAELLGFHAPGEFIGRKFEEFWIRHDTRSAFRIRQQFLGNGRLDGELKLRRRDGGTVTVLANCKVQRDAQGRFLHSHCIVADISERLAMEEEIRELNATLERKVAERTAQLKSANDAKSIFLANMSHEIRTPLNAIVGLTELLRQETHDLRQKRRLDQLSESSQHLIGVINDILDISKIEAGQLMIDQTEFRLGSIPERVQRLLSQHARQKGLVLSTRVERTLGDLRLKGDPLRLSQVLINLCSNAIKFTEQGQVDLSISRLDGSDEAVTLLFKVTDTGCGIDLADQGVLFKPFIQLDPSSTRQHGGTGLGLAISQHLMRMMDSRIELSSAIGIGSTFSFTLTLPCAGAPPADEASDASPASFGHRRILLAEDQPLSQEILLEMLDNLGCDADIACDGEAAVDYARQQRYDLILMDMQMPRLDGLGATRAIRRLPGYKHTPIIALTANAFAEDRQRCLDAGMNAHLGKPVTLARLAALLGQWLPRAPVRKSAAIAADGHPLRQALRGLPDLDLDPHAHASPAQLHALCKVLTRFIPAGVHSLEELRACIARGDHETAGRLAHDLKGLAGLVGARGIARLAHRLELRFRNAALAPPGDTQPEINGIEDILARLKPAVASLPTGTPEAAAPTGTGGAAPFTTHGD